MRNIEYSRVVQRKLKALKMQLCEKFNEKEDFMLKLFGVCGRTQESIDYWGD